MDRLIDQRDLTQGAASTPELLRIEWDVRAARRGKVLLLDERTVLAYVNEGRWVADCPNCNAGMMTWPENPQGCCLGCFHVYTVEHPPADVIGEALPVLLERPEINRNWVVTPETDEWEPVEVLQEENATMLEVEGFEVSM